MDLFHYRSPGTHALDNGPDRFFFIDNGATLLKEFNDGSASPTRNLSCPPPAQPQTQTPAAICRIGLLAATIVLMHIWMQASGTI